MKGNYVKVAFSVKRQKNDKGYYQFVYKVYVSPVSVQPHRKMMIERYRELIYE